MKKVCTVGSATHDMFIVYEGADTLHLHQKKNRCSYMILEKGTKIDVPHITYSSGGGATNSAVGLTRLGLLVEPYFRTGDDSAGKAIRDALAAEQISTKYCPIDKAHATAISIIIPSIENDHAAFCYRAANRFQSKDEFPLSLLQGLDLLFIAPLGGSSVELLPHLAPAAKDAGIPIAINPGTQQLTHNTAQFIDVLKQVDTLIVNMLESGYLMKALLEETHAPLFLTNSSNGPFLLQPYVHFNDHSYSINDIAQQVLSCGPRTLIITNGSEGVYVVTDEKIYFHPSIPDERISTLGAGDAFSSAFLGSRLLGLPISTALRYGVLNATSVISYSDAQKGLLTLTDLEKRSQELSPSLLIESSLS